MSNATIAQGAWSLNDIMSTWQGEEAQEILADAAEIEQRLADARWRTHQLGHPVPLRTSVGTWEEMRLDQARIIRMALLVASELK